MSASPPGASDLDALLEEAAAEQKRGELQTARERCLAVLDRDWQSLKALVLLAHIDADERNVKSGLEWAARAVARKPDSAEAHYAMGRLLEMDSQLAESEASYRCAITLAPENPKAHNNLGAVLHMQGRLEEALACYRKALQLDPAQPEATQNLASIVRDPAALERAAAGYRRQIAANPKDAIACNNLANTLRELGRHREALEQFARAVELEPDFAEAHFSRSFVLLLLGEYRAGFREHEWRWALPAFNAPAHRFSEPLWDGRALPEATLLLHAEQGLGDTLQFVRYARLAAQRAGKVVLECQPELAALLRSVDGLSQVVARGDPLPAFQAQLPLISLAAVFETTLESIPWDGPYVQADAQRRARWRALLRGEPGHMNVGLAWAGRPQQWDDRKRSMALSDLAPLARAAGCRFFSLQIGPAAAQSAAPPAGMDLRDLTAHISDFSDTAALATELDLIVTVDTSVAHLGGALGVPTWVLVAHAPDWRYHLEREDHPWYPRMRLFRQPRDGDWATAIERLADELALRAARHRAASPGN